MDKRIVFAFALLSVPGALPALAESPIAEVVCAPRDQMVERLTHRFGADLAATGIRDVEAVVEVWTAPSGRWTLVQTYADGQTCILAMGESWDMPRLQKAG